MVHLNTIKQLQGLFPAMTGVDAAILYGSYARNEPTVNSDLDIQLIVNKSFQSHILLRFLEQELSESSLLKIMTVTSRSKLVIYFHSKPKIEIAFANSVEEIKRNYIGSEIHDYQQTILFERESEKTKLEEVLYALLNDKNNIPEYQNAEILLEKFLYEFESCSTMHRRSDGYQFYFFYNIALHVAFQLHNMSKGIVKFNFLPKYLLAGALQSNEQDEAYKLKGTMFLPEANAQKRKLLDFAYKSIEALFTSEKVQEIKCMCEYIFERDFFWNFRDIANNNPLIKTGIIYRTATLTVFQNEPRFIDLRNNKKIKSIVDLRADREIEEKPYNPESISDINYVKCQFDPWNQPDWFKEKYHFGTNEEIAYRFFALGCREQIKRAFETILNNHSGATAIHCFAGKDRTGIFISMIHLLSGASQKTIETDYLASEVDVKLYRLQLVLDSIKAEGGIETYLINCGLTKEQIRNFKDKLFVYGNN